MRVLHVVAETPGSFLQHLKEVTFIERKPLRFCSKRLALLIKTLELNDLADFGTSCLIQARYRKLQLLQPLYLLIIKALC